ncbi:MAG: hypothetical protein WCO19_01955 [Candidatus Saccharibacteria bacterium]
MGFLDRVLKTAARALDTVGKAAGNVGQILDAVGRGVDALARDTSKAAAKVERAVEKVADAPFAPFDVAPMRKPRAKKEKPGWQPVIVEPAEPKPKKERPAWRKVEIEEDLPDATEHAREVTPEQRARAEAAKKLPPIDASKPPAGMEANSIEQWRAVLDDLAGAGVIPADFPEEWETWAKEKGLDYRVHAAFDFEGYYITKEHDDQELTTGTHNEVETLEHLVRYAIVDVTGLGGERVHITQIRMADAQGPKGKRQSTTTLTGPRVVERDGSKVGRPREHRQKKEETKEEQKRRLARQRQQKHRAVKAKAAKKKPKE